MPDGGVFKPGTWVRVLYNGPRLIGKVTAHVTTNSGHEFVGFYVDDIEYTMPPVLLERTLNPYLEDLAKILFSEDLAGAGLDIEQVRLLITKISTYLDVHKEAIQA